MIHQEGYILAGLLGMVVALPPKAKYEALGFGQSANQRVERSL